MGTCRNAGTGLLRHRVAPSANATPYATTAVALRLRVSAGNTATAPSSIQDATSGVCFSMRRGTPWLRHRWRVVVGHLKDVTPVFNGREP